MNEDLAGRIMAHAFNDELEKISAARWNRSEGGAMGSKELGRTSSRYRAGGKVSAYFKDDPGYGPAGTTVTSRASYEEPGLKGPKSAKAKAIYDAESAGYVAKQGRRDQLKKYRASSLGSRSSRSTRSGLIAATGATSRPVSKTYKSALMRARKEVSGGLSSVLAKFR
jgi:hypothetical protein